MSKKRKPNTKDSIADKPARGAKGLLQARAKLNGDDVDNIAHEICQAFVTGVGSSFKVPRNLTRARSILSSWRPQLQGHTDIDLHTFDVGYRASRFLKKYLTRTESAASADLEESAYSTFKSICTAGYEINDAFSEGYLSNDPVIREMRSIIADILGEVVDKKELFLMSGFGPNSSRQVSLEMSYEDIKWWCLGGTRKSAALFGEYVAYFRNISSRYFPEYSVMSAPKGEGKGFTIIDELALSEGFPRPSDEVAINEALEGWSTDQISDTCLLSFVPKDFDKLRTMCVANNSNMFFQLGLGRMISRRLKTVGIDLATQPDVHRNLARLGSRMPNANLATIDWSEASDRLWIGLCQQVVPKTWMYYFLNIREQYAEYKGEKICLPMIGTMGNGFTFPLQTLLFYAFLTACTRLTRAQQCHRASVKAALRSSLAGSFELADQMFPGSHDYVSSFGDDGIVSSYAIPMIKDYADKFGWKLNLEKSYYDGSFRESCGGNFYRGGSVGRFAMKRPSCFRKSHIKAWIYINVNLILSDGSFQPLSLRRALLRAVEKLFAQYGLGKIHIVPLSSPEGSGIRAEIEGDLYRSEMWYLYPLDVRNRLIVKYLSAWADLASLNGEDPGNNLLDLYHVPYTTHDRLWCYRVLEQRIEQRSPFRGEFFYYANSLLDAHRSSCNLSLDACGDRLFSSFFDLSMNARNSVSQVTTEDGITKGKGGMVVIKQNKIHCVLKTACSYM